MLMKPPFRTAIVGNIQALNVLLPAFRAAPEFHVTTLAGRNGEALRAAAAKAGGLRVVPGWGDLVADAEIEVVVLALPPFLQSPAALELAAAGKALFCEKPLAADLASAEAMLRVAVR